MNTRTQKITIWDDVLPQTVTSSTDATPIVVTKAAHGYTTGDLIMIQGHTTNIAANGIFKIVVLTANTFQLYDLYTGAAVAGSGAGAGSGGVMVKMSTNQIPIYTEEFQTQVFQFFTSGTATLTVKLAISQGRPTSQSLGANQGIPAFGATVTPSNPYTFADLIPQDTTTPGTPIAGTTGIVASGADIAENYEIGTKLQRFLFPLLTAWTAGRITGIMNISNRE